MSMCERQQFLGRPDGNVGSPAIQSGSKKARVEEDGDEVMSLMDKQM